MKRLAKDNPASSEHPEEQESHLRGLLASPIQAGILPPKQQQRSHSHRANGVTQFCYVPDAGHKVLIDRSLADPDVHSVPLTTEEEGVAMVAGADLGGQRAVLLMQSSGVGNCINMLSLTQGGRFPLLTLVSMRGEYGEGNPWQFAMGQAVEPVLKAMGVIVLRAEQP